MELNISSIKDLTSIPKEYTSNSRAIEYLYQNNPNIFENVADNLNLSFEFIEKITELINNGTLRLTENNIKLLDSLYSENIIDILKNHFDYLYLINENNFNQTGLATDPVFLELLEEHKIEITGNSPYLITLCSDYIIKQYIEDKVNIIREDLKSKVGGLAIGLDPDVRISFGADCFDKSIKEGIWVPSTDSYLVITAGNEPVIESI